MAEGEKKTWVQQKLETPCYRSSMLYGVSSGLGTGLAYFLFTSRTRTATHVGMASYVGVTLASWCYCHYNLAKQEVQEKIFRKAFEQKLLREGTMADPQQWQDVPAGAGSGLVLENMTRGSGFPDETVNNSNTSNTDDSNRQR